MVDSDAIREAILAHLSTVIDPETGVDVVRMQLVGDLAVDEKGVAHYTFCPSSPFCPLAVPLAQAIRGAVASVEGVTGQEIKVEGYIQADELSATLRQSEEKG